MPVTRPTYRLSVWDDERVDWLTVAGGRTAASLLVLLRGLRVAGELGPNVLVAVEEEGGLTAQEARLRAAEELWP